MKNRSYFVVLAMVLIAVSAAVYLLHFFIFHDEHHIFIFMLHDIAFLPLEVLLVGLIIERILARREKFEKLQKLNMVIGAYFSEVGRPLSGMLLDATDQKDILIENLNINKDWAAADYQRARLYVDKGSVIKFNNINLIQLRSFLADKRGFLLRLIENPNLLEHEKFTDLLLSSFHLMEELESRTSLDNLPKNDTSHIMADIHRAFKNLALEWLDYMQHLKTNYPYLYSHYLRISPFQLKPSAIIE